jgi:hypothetical protein
MVFFKPYNEGKIDPKNEKSYAAGSSGGPVSAPGLGILGSFSAIKTISDTCGDACLVLPLVAAGQDSHDPGG